MVATREHQLSFVHGSFAPSGKSAITRFGTAEVEPKPHALEKLARELHFDRYECATLLHPGEYQLLLVEAPAVPQAELKSAIRWRIKDMLDYHVDDAAMDVLDIPVENDAPGKSHYMYAVAAKNETVKAQKHAEAMKIFTENMPSLPLFARAKILVTRAGVDGAVMDATANSELWNVENFDLGQN